MGLAVVQHIVEMHGGSVQAHSAGRGHGATFTIKLPIPALTGTREERTAAPAAAAVQLDDVRVLVVDDEAEAREVLRSALTCSVRRCRPSSSIDAAIETLPTWQPHVLVSDLGLAGEDGYTLIRRVRALECRDRGTHAGGCAHCAGAPGRPPAGAGGGIPDARRQAGRAAGARSSHRQPDRTASRRRRRLSARGTTAREQFPLPSRERVRRSAEQGPRFAGMRPQRRALPRREMQHVFSIKGSAVPEVEWARTGPPRLPEKRGGDLTVRKGRSEFPRGWQQAPFPRFRGGPSLAALPAPERHGGNFYMRRGRFFQPAPRRRSSARARKRRRLGDSGDYAEAASRRHAILRRRVEDDARREPKSHSADLVCEARARAVSLRSQ